MSYTRLSKLKVGTVELCDLPELGIEKLHVRVDTGAATSSLHVDNIEEFSRGGKDFVSFDLHPDIHNVDSVIRTTSPVEGTKTVKSSSADTEQRVVITTNIRLAGREWPIKLTLTNRSEMTYMMLMGREAMEGRIIVDPEFDYLLNDADLDDDDYMQAHGGEEE
jgi:hypothetical protein